LPPKACLLLQSSAFPDKAVEESKERVRSAIKNSGVDFPVKRITVNLALTDLPKEGSSYDLPIALGIMLASEQIKADISDTLFTDELSLDGKLTAGDNIKRETSAQIRKRVQKTRDIQLKRFKNTKISSNAEVANRNIKKIL